MTPIVEHSIKTRYQCVYFTLIYKSSNYSSFYIQNLPHSILVFGSYLSTSKYRVINKYPTSTQTIFKTRCKCSWYTNFSKNVKLKLIKMIFFENHCKYKVNVKCMIVQYTFIKVIPAITLTVSVNNCSKFNHRVLQSTHFLDNLKLAPLVTRFVEATRVRASTSVKMEKLASEYSVE